MADLFISYARSDRDKVAQLAARLEGQGVATWWDRRLVGGDDFAALIEQELDAAQAVVVVWTQAGIKSHWVRDEASFAARAGKLIAISLDGTAPPMGFGQFHSIDFSSWNGAGDDLPMQELLRAIAARTSATAKAPPTSAHAKAAAVAPDTVADDMPWIAVVPIKVRGSDPDLPDLAEDLGQNIANGLARFSYLKVGMEGSGEEGRNAGASYLLECSLRQVGAKLRLSVRLSDSKDGRQVWGENYNRAFDPDTVFEVQDDLTDHLVAGLADPYGALMHDLSASVLDLAPEDMTPYQALLRTFVYRQRVTAEDHAIAQKAIEIACARQPLNSDLWAARGLMYLEQYKNKHNDTNHSVRPALDCARRAVALNPQSAYAQFALTDTSFHAKDVQGTRTAAQRCLALNPRDTDAQAMIGIDYMFMDDWEQGLKCTQRALDLHGNGPGWYRFGLVMMALHEGRFEDALAELGQVHMPQYHIFHTFLTITLAGLGRVDESHAAWQDLLACWPGDMAAYRESFNRWHYAQPDYHGLVLSLFDKAGISLEDGSVRDTVSDNVTASIERNDFVGREAERKTLQGMLEAAQAGRGSLVLIGGEPGVGKSRLVEEVQARGVADGMLALTGHSYEERGLPFVSTIETLESLERLMQPAELRALLGPGAAEFLRIMPAWRERFPDLGEPADVPPEQQRRALFNALADLLLRLAARQPLVMMLDDLHWADESSMELLEHVVPLLGQAPVLMLATYRDAVTDMGEPFRRGMATLIRRKEVHRVSLGQLGAADVDELLQRWTGISPPDELSAAIHAGTEGNAFFVREVFAFLKESGQLLNEDGSWNLAVDIDSINVPEGVRLVIGQRLERLGEAAQDVLLVAAAFGLRFQLEDVEVAAKVRGRAGGSALDELEAAEAAQLINTMNDTRAPRYEFVHALVRQTLLESQSPARLQRLHAQIAETLDTHYGARAIDRPSVLANHYFAARASADASRARYFMRLAGEQAEAASAWDEAWAWFDRSLDNARDLEDDERGALLYRRGMANRARQRWDEAMADWNMALDLLEAEGPADVVAEICFNMGQACMWTGDYRRGSQIIERGLLRLGDGISAGRCRLLALSAHCCSLEGDFERCKALMAEAIPAAEQLGDPLLLGAEVLLSELFRGEHSMQITELTEAGERAVVLVREHGNDWQLSAVLGIMLTGLLCTGQNARWIQMVDEVITLASNEGNLGALMQGRAWKGMTSSLLGDHKVAVQELGHSIEICKVGGFPWVSVIYGMLAYIQMLHGNFEQALLNADLAEEHHNPRGAHKGLDLGMALITRAQLGEPKAEAMLKLDLEPAHAGQDNGIGNYFWSLGLVTGGALLGRPHLAAAQLPVIEQLIAQGALDCWGLTLTRRVAAIAACCANDREATHQHFAKALQEAEQFPSYPEQLNTRLWYAWALQRLDEDAPRALRLQDEAREVADRFAMQAWCAKLTDVLNLTEPQGASGGVSGVSGPVQRKPL